MHRGPRGHHAAMDPLSCFALLQPSPTTMDGERATFAGALGPVTIPLSWVPEQTLGQWAIADEQLHLAERARLGLQADLAPAVWKMLQRELAGRRIEHRLDSVLASWAAREQARLALGPAHGGIIIHGGESRLRTQHSRSLARALVEARSLFISLPWPRWSGPLVVQLGETTSVEWRPALPLVEIPDSGDDRDRRAALGQAISDLVLASAAPPSAGWPAWLSEGLGAVSAQRAMGGVPSPLRSLRTRQQQGGAALNSLWRATTLDDEQRALSAAVVVLLTSERRRGQLNSLLDLIRNGVSAPEAITIAYGLSSGDLLRER